MARRELSVEPREVLGKKVAALRRSGVLPGNVYGRGLESVSVQIATESFESTLKTLVANEVIDLKLKGERGTRPVVIHRVQRHPLGKGILHAEFYQVSLREKMRAEVPVVLVGKSDAVETYNGILLQESETVHVEALPLDLPSSVELDVSALAELDTSLHVRDLVFPGNVTVLSDPDVVVARVASPRVSEEELEPAAAAEEAPAEEAEEETPEPAAASESEPEAERPSP
jgi:large subunit ribosomal protein L25